MPDDSLGYKDHSLWCACLGATSGRGTKWYEAKDIVQLANELYEEAKLNGKPYKKTI